MYKFLIMFLLNCFLFSTVTYAKNKEIKTLLFSASWCGQCQRLKAGMEKELKKDQRIQVTIDGQDYFTNIEVVDVSDRKVWKENEKKYGKIEGVPNLLVEMDNIVIGNNIRLDVKHTPTVEDIRTALIKTIKTAKN